MHFLVVTKELAMVKQMTSKSVMFFLSLIDIERFKIVIRCQIVTNRMECKNIDICRIMISCQHNIAILI